MPTQRRGEPAPRVVGSYVSGTKGAHDRCGGSTPLTSKSRKANSDHAGRPYLVRRRLGEGGTAAALRSRHGQPHRRPRGGALRDPLIVAVGEGAFEVRLDLHRPALHVPRAVVLLRP